MVCVNVRHPLEETGHQPSKVISPARGQAELGKMTSILARA